MPSLTVKNIRIAGIAACVPARVEENLSLPGQKDAIFTDEEIRKVIATTGIKRHRAVDDGVTASDLTVKAVEGMLRDLGWEASEVDCLIYVCTSRDFIAPQTACILQHRLGLRNDSFVMDLPLGCSGWVYAMSVIGSMMTSGSFKKGLLIAAETNTLNRSKTDRTVRPLFGDAATVTALEFNPESSPMNFTFGVDGSGYQAIWTKYGGMRFPTTSESLEPVEYEPGITRRGTDMIVNGMDVFGFAISIPPKALKEFISEFKIDTNKIDYLILHQANKFINEKICKSLKIPSEKVPYCLEDFGNGTSASIPLTLVTRCGDALRGRPCSLLACGFGIGLAWATMNFSTDGVVITPLIEY